MGSNLITLLKSERVLWLLVWWQKEKSGRFAFDMSLPPLKMELATVEEKGEEPPTDNQQGDGDVSPPIARNCFISTD